MLVLAGSTSLLLSTLAWDRVAVASEEGDPEEEAPGVPAPPSAAASMDTGETIFDDDFTFDHNIFPTFSSATGVGKTENGKYVISKMPASASIRVAGQNILNLWERAPGKILRFEITASSPANPVNLEYPMFFLGNVRGEDPHSYMFGVLPNGKVRVSEMIGNLSDRHMFPREIWDNTYSSIRRGSSAENRYAVVVTSTGKMQFFVNSEPVGPQLDGNQEVIIRGFGVGAVSRPHTSASASFDDLVVTAI